MQGTLPKIGRGIATRVERRSFTSTLWGATVRHRVLIGIIALIGMMIINSVATGFDLAMRLAYLLVILVIISWVWSRVGAINMKASVNRPTGPFSVGDVLSERIIIQNSNGAPKAWVEVEDKTTLPDVHFREVTNFGLMVTFKARQHGSRSYPTRRIRPRPTRHPRNRPLQPIPSRHRVRRHRQSPRIPARPTHPRRSVFARPPRRWSFAPTANARPFHRRFFSTPIRRRRPHRPYPLAHHRTYRRTHGQTIRSRVRR